MNNAVTIINQDGGSASADAADKVHAALAKAGVESDVQLVSGADCAARTAKAVEAGAAMVIAGGGDGTISSIAGVLAGSQVRLGILPLGTLNHFARDLGIPLDLDEAAALIASGTERSVDVAEVNDRTFINNSAIGLYPQMVVDRDAQRRRLGRAKWFALLVASVRTLARFRHQRLRLTVNDLPTVADTPLLFVGNNDYRLEFPGAGSRESLSDGRLSVLVMRSKSRAGFLAATARILIGRARDNEMVRLDEVTRLRVESNRRMLPVSLDGETLRLEPPLTYSIRPAALKVIAP